MDDGGYKIILDLPPYQIDDCGSYFMIYKNHKYIGEFKNRDEAVKYCLRNFLRDIFEGQFNAAFATPDPPYPGTVHRRSVVYKITNATCQCNH